MIDGPTTIFEAFHEALSVDDFRDCVRKQLTADHLDVLAAKATDQPRPPFPRLWIFAAGRAKAVIRGYGLAPMPSFPTAFLEGQPEERVGLVVLPELPRTRETLLLRLMAAGEVLRAALAELAGLPEDAWERQIAMPPLLALRIEIPQDSPDPDETEYLMSSMEILEQWQQEIARKARDEGVEQGIEKGLKKGLLKLYRARFSGAPPAIVAAIEAMHDPETLDRWLDLFAVKPADEIAAALSAR
jgi:hypothetical protein